MADPSTAPGIVRVAAFYRFAPVAEPAALRRELAEFAASRRLKGTLLVAAEGINGTLAGSGTAVDELVGRLREIPGCAELEVKLAEAAAMPFHRLKVRLKKEIVTMGVPGLDPARRAGTRLDAAAWNALLDDPETIVLDTRNGYEVALGSFRGAIDPQTASFREFPAWLAAHKERLAGRKVAMFCTGGIRCEKATAYARALGLEQVFHLDGGILRYLEAVEPAASRWQGECFVFDERVAVGHGLAAGEATLCRACRRPLTAADRKSPLYREGISCADCHGRRSDEDRARYAERHRQVGLAAARGGRRHVGSL